MLPDARMEGSAVVWHSELVRRVGRAVLLDGRGCVGSLVSLARGRQVRLFARNPNDRHDDETPSVTAAKP